MATAELEEGPRSKRTAILRAAVQYFGEVGYEATKWSAVADRVGIGQTALYHYFESKAHCLLTIMRMELQRSHDRFVQATAGIAVPAAGLRAAVAVAYEASEHEVLQLRILQSNIALLANRRRSKREEAERQAARKLVRQIEKDWTVLVQRGMDDGTFAPGDAHTVALALLGLIVSVWRWYRPGGALSLPDVSQFITGCCMRIVAA
ncbi:MAG TPA: TetR/AcrR family transcriptional regulator [Kribbellaceae bacterium]|nr:TetR/AcrR family transcriptional regulator [Kribbellaceae bacterium]